MLKKEQAIFIKRNLLILLDKEEIFHIRVVYYKTNASGPYKGTFLQNVKVLGLLTLPSIITVEREKKIAILLLSNILLKYNWKGLIYISFSYS